MNLASGATAAKIDELDLKQRQQLARPAVTGWQVEINLRFPRDTCGGPSGDTRSAVMPGACGPRLGMQESR